MPFLQCVVKLKINLILFKSVQTLAAPDFIDRADRELKLTWPAAIRPIGLRDESIEFDRCCSRSAYQTQSSRPPSGFAALGRLAR